MLIPAVLMSPTRLPCSRMASLSLTSTLPCTRPKMTTSRALMLARTLPFGPTVSRLCDSSEPSTSPSTSSSSCVRMSPLMNIDEPIAAIWGGGGAGAGAGASRLTAAMGVAMVVVIGSGCDVRGAGPSSLRLFHKCDSPWMSRYENVRILHSEGHTGRARIQKTSAAYGILRAPST
ncbi:hypothetical protein SBA4_1880009 [Candidatus Sulfopaludibacter sp. SbA4]|nr:hypothetical protein SBA4_1880009 [Candidatus Sulfopaludibacter sp. SbA4]